MDLFLDVERWGMDDEVGPVLLVLAAPDQLRIQIPIAPLVGHAHGRLLVLAQDRLVLGRRDVLAGGVVVDEGLDGERCGALLLPCHGQVSSGAGAGDWWMD